MKFKSLTSRLMLLISLITLLVMTLSFFWNADRSKQRAELEVREKARVIANQFLALRTFMAQSQDPQEIQPGGELQYKHLNPVALQNEVNKAFGKDIKVTFKEIWPAAINPANMPSEFEKALLEELKKNDNLDEVWGTYSNNGQRMFTYMIPIYMEDQCLVCHSEGVVKAKSRLPQKHSLGELAGAICLNIPMDEFQRNLRFETFVHLVFTSVLILLIISSIYLLMRTMLNVPLQKLTKMATEIGQGNLEHCHWDIKAGGEIELLAREFQSMAEKLKKYYGDLEKEVAVRTKELTKANQILKRQKEKLKEANIELSKTNKLKSDFLASVSHELRTPLTSIMAFAEMLLDGTAGEITDLQREYLNDIYRNSQQLHMSINDILDMAKIEAGRMELQISVFPLPDLIHEVLQRNLPLAIKKKQSIITEVEPSLPDVEADRGKIGQILNNLVGNALKFTPFEGKIKIEARMHSNGRNIICSVQDNGPGIKEEDQPIIFQAFRQLSSSSTREHRGYGLGLALAKNLVEMHKCAIWVESQPGKGSKFSFTIPIVQKS